MSYDHEIDDHEIHDFLLDSQGRLLQAARDIPTVREFVEDLPETAGQFRLNQIEDIYHPKFEDVHLEFVQSWPVHDFYAPEKDRMYVNPSYVHGHKYTDLVVTCQCGAQLTCNYQDEHNALRNEHNHTEDCLPHWRLEARRKIAKQRYDEYHRLVRLGWRGTDLVPRFGMVNGSIGTVCSSFNTTFEETYYEYKRIAGNTYRYLVHDRDVAADTVGEIYGVLPETLRRYANDHATYVPWGDDQ